MHRPGFIAGSLCHPFCRPACRRCQKNFHFLLFKIPDNRVDSRGFSRSRSSGNNQKPTVYRFNHSLYLKLIRLNLLFCADPLQLFPDFPLWLRTSQIQIVKHSGCIQLHVIILGRIDLLPLHHDFLFHLQIHQMLFHTFRSHMKQLGGSCKKLLFWKVCMSVCHRLKQGIKDTAANPEIRICKDSYPLSNLICHLKSHALNIVRQLIGIFFNNAVQAGTIFVVDFQSQIHGNPIFLQKHHRLTQILFRFHLLRNRHGHFLTDSLYLSQPLRLLLDNAKGICLKPADNPGRQSRSHTFHSAGSKIAFHRRRILRRFQLIGLYLNLITVYRMLYAAAAGFNKITLTDIGKGSHQHIFLSVTVDRKNRIAIFLISKFNFLHISIYCCHRPAPVKTEKAPRQKRAARLSYCHI